MNFTPNFSLKLPGYEDFAEVDDLNFNNIVLDTQVKKAQTDLAETRKWINVVTTTAQTIPNNIETDIFWGNMSNNNGADFATLQGGKIVLKKGLYTINAVINFLPNANGRRSLIIENLFANDISVSAVFDSRFSLDSLISVPTDNFTLPCRALQDSGGALDLRNNYTGIRIRKVGEI